VATDHPDAAKAAAQLASVLTDTARAGELCRRAIAIANESFVPGSPPAVEIADLCARAPGNAR
jgi:hypothetical protein